MDLKNAGNRPAEIGLFYCGIWLFRFVKFFGKDGNMGSLSRFLVDSIFSFWFSFPILCLIGLFFVPNRLRIARILRKVFALFIACYLTWKYWQIDWIYFDFLREAMYSLPYYKHLTLRDSPYPQSPIITYCIGFSNAIEWEVFNVTFHELLYRPTDQFLIKLDEDASWFPIETMQQYPNVFIDQAYQQDKCYKFTPKLEKCLREWAAAPTDLFIKLDPDVGISFTHKDYHKFIRNIW